MAQGAQLAQFYLGEAVRLSDASTVSAEIGRAEALRRWLIEQWSEQDIIPREIQQFGPNALRESPKVRAAIGILVDHGWLVPLPEGTVIRGAPRKLAYRIVRGADVV
ncbi:hypothetical protein M1105_20365 [Limibaculum sp. FT325]|uniref:hypothetical protein n=1 Tax=Thermohalobaculum sediminis TaxID=2939436 RepID=UPI0020BDC1D0|nr:hypothetical protein [Limibaculum sediminis]MCL5779306.1 hypothetical protein [Limibaculum sediminis]